MLNIEASAFATQSVAMARTNRGDETASSQLAKTPPTQTAVPEQAVTPVQSGEAGQMVHAQADQVREAVERLNDTLRKYRPLADTAVRFSVNDQADVLVVQVIDRETDEILRQIPGEDVLNRLSSRENMKGLLFDTES
ncbi:MAG: flagellar protein FlaG [Nitrospirae bacterium]|nr:flagellar protein FlaG [Nitrospirota bacterium]